MVAGDPVAGQRLVTGDAVNVAARLEQAAPALEVLVGDPTYQLVRDYVDVEEVEPLELKGKSERVPAYRLLGVKEPSVGDESRPPSRSSAATRSSAGCSRSSMPWPTARTCRAATVLGDAGVGKTRLLEELQRRVAPDARVLRGRCLSYGRGITFWPVLRW